MKSIKHSTPVGDIEVQTNPSTVTVFVDGHARIGVIYDEPDCDDPTVVIWNNNEGDDTVVALHLGKLDWDQPAHLLAQQLMDEMRDYV